MPSERVQRRIDRLLDQIDAAEVAEDWSRVKNLALDVLKVDSGNEEAEAYLESADRRVESSENVTVPSSRVALDGAPTSSTDQPTSFAGGRYTVSKFLGEGGKKKVYLAHDNTLDRDVAFALIKTEGLDETSRERVKREAQAMGRMGTHPCIMPIYDLGEENDQPFMVQPLMGGGDVEGLVEDAEGPLELDRALEIATQTAQGLSFAHSKGIVHRDLKPGNVWLDEDGAAKIGDFGLAVATDRSRLTVEKVMVGTVSYMPPEQATGGEVTPRADLYSLGAMLYEMCTGRVPFMGDDDIGIISQHINTPPVAPSWHNIQIPKTLDSLILRLLSKDPSERPSDADEVLAALDAVDLTAVEEREEESKGSLDAMAGGVFVGRHREMDQLKSIFEDVLSGKGRMVTLVGEPGIGKTRTAQELATYVGMRNAAVLWGRSYEGGGAPPYWPWVQAIRSHVAATEPDDLRRQMGSTASVIAEVVTDVKESLPDISTPTPIEDPESARFRLFDSISTFLKNTASSTPLVLMLEDLHWADKPSLMLLEFVARELANSRLLIVGNYRDMELNRRHPLSVTLGDLTRERLFERVLLRGLQRHDVERFIEIAAGIKPPPALVDTVHAQTEGNPLFVTETVRLLIQEGDIASGQSTASGTTSWEIRIPEGVREVIGRRLDRLSERCNEVLTIAAVIGRQFRFDVLKILMKDSTDGQMLDAMDEALSARIIEELPDEIGLYQFTHASMQETLTSELSANRLVRMHARIADALEGYYGDDAEQHAEELAEHFAESETVLGSDRLLRYSIIAGESALEANAYESARKYLERAEAAIDESGDSINRARILHLLGRSIVGSADVLGVQQGWDLLARSYKMYRSLGAEAESIAPLIVGIQLHLVKGANEVLKEAVDRTPKKHPEYGWLLARYAISVRNELGDVEQERSLLTDAVNFGMASDDQALAARATAHLAQSLDQTFEPNQTVEAGLKALELERAKPDISTSSRANACLHRAYARLGDVEKAYEYQRAWIAQSETTRYRNLMAGTRSTLAKWKRMEGDFGASDKLTSEYAEISDFDVSANWLRVVSYYDAGELQAGDEVLQSSLADWAKIPYLGGNVPCIATFAPLLGYREIFGDYERQLRNAVGLGGNLIYGQRELERNTALAMLAAGKGDVEAVAALKPSIESYSGLANPDQIITIDRVLGHISLLLGEFDQADAYFTTATQLSENAGWRREVALAKAFHAEGLIQRGANVDREKAIELQDEAISIATELGMKPLLERVLAKREKLKA